MTDVVIEKKGHVAIVKIEHMKAMNALSTDMYAQLEEAFDELAKDLDNVYAVVLTGSSTVNKKGKTVNSFVAGADISEMATKTCEEGKLFGNESNRVCWKIENFKRPVIAAINGFCLGGGCELAMSCDIRLASEKAKFGQPEVGLGITPGFGGTQRLARIVGVSNAMELILTAKVIKAEEAKEMGLVSHVYPAEELMDKAMELAQAIAANAQVAVIVLNSALCTDQLGLSIDVDPALLDILGKAGHTVQAVALDAFQTALGVDLSALFSLLLAQAQIQECLRNGRFDSFIRYANTHIHSLLFDQRGGLVVSAFFLLRRMFADISAYPLILSA